MKKKKPIINVSNDVMTRRTYTLTDAASKILESYAQFLSDHESFRVSQGDILSQLVLKLHKDKLFIEWQRREGFGLIIQPGKKNASATVNGEKSHV